MKEREKWKMPKYLYNLRTLSVLLMVFIIMRTLHAATDAPLNMKLEEAVAKVRETKPSIQRNQAAEQLARLTNRVNPALVDDKTIADITSLLDIPDDSVRAWTAAALGHLGRRAKAAAPNLLALLPEVDCLQGDLTSAAAIRPALKRMGITPPPAPSYNDCPKAK